MSRECYRCHSRDLRPCGCGVQPDAEPPIVAQWLQCQHCGEYIRVDLATGEIIVRAAYAPEALAVRRVQEVAAKQPR